MRNSHQIQFSKLHAERADKINQFYQTLQYFHSDIIQITRLSDGQHTLLPTLVAEKRFPIEEVLANLQQNRDKLWGTFKFYEILFPEDLCKLIVTMFDAIGIFDKQALTPLYATIRELEAYSGDEIQEAEFIINSVKHYKKEYESIDASLESLSQMLRNEFRKLLGVIVTN